LPALAFLPLLCFTLAAIVSGCASGPPPGVPADAVTVTAASRGQTITLQTGQMLLVELLADPTSDQVWELVAPPNQLILMPDGTRLVRTAAQAALDQQVRTQQLRFVAQAPGQTALRLLYVNPQQPPPADAPEFHIVVIVSEVVAP
jgi:predicted secreted protein